MVRKSKNVLLVTLYSTGMIGSLAGLTLIYSPGFELMEQKFSKKLPPVAVIHKSQPLSPIRLYRNRLDGMNLYLLISEISLSMVVAPMIYSLILKIIKTLKIDYVIFLSSISDVEYNYVTNISPVPNTLASMKPIREGALGGPLAMILPYIHDRINYIALFAPNSSKSNPDIPSTISLLNRFRELFRELFNQDINIDMSILESYQKNQMELPKIDQKDNRDIYR